MTPDERKIYNECDAELWRLFGKKSQRATERKFRLVEIMNQTKDGTTPKPLLTGTSFK